MPTDKRQRQKQARRQRQEAMRIAQQRAARRRQGIRLAAVLIAVIMVMLTVGMLRGDDDTNVTAGDDTTSTTSAAGETPKAEYGTTECPPEDASGERKTAFEDSFKKCIDVDTGYMAIMETDAGTIEIELDPSKAPVTVNNFVALARHHYFDDVPFHRVIPDFVVQGGDAEKGDGTGGPGYTFGDELPDPSEYAEGSLAMANSGPGTNGSQFFIITSQTGAETLVKAVGGKANYSLFGKVTEGMDVVKAIEADGDPSGTPKKIHKITKVTIKES